MPEISRFLGIIITMKWDEHNPPHFHAEYAGKEVVVNIRDLNVGSGRLPARVMGLGIEGAEMHRDELLANWDLAQAGKPIRKIKPLV